jgi:hypothetical protein
MTQHPPVHHILLADPDKGICNLLTEHLSHASGLKAFGVHEKRDFYTQLEGLNQSSLSASSSQDTLTILVMSTHFLTPETQKILSTLHGKGLEIPILIYGADEPITQEAVEDEINRSASFVDVQGDAVPEYDVFLATPFHPRMLLAHVRELIAMGEARRIRPERIVLGGVVVHPLLKQIITPEGKVVKLTEKECGIVLFLYHNRPSVVSRHDLLSKVWGYNAHVTTHTLETHIYRLRQKLESNPATARILITESGGYRLDI